MSEQEPVIYINVERMLAVRIDPAAYGLAMSLIMEVWFPTKEPFIWDAEALAQRISAPRATPAELEKHKAEAQRLFVLLPDGRWAPSPDLFSLTDGNPGGHVV